MSSTQNPLWVVEREELLADRTHNLIVSVLLSQPHGTITRFHAILFNQEDICSHEVKNIPTACILHSLSVAAILSCCIVDMVCHALCYPSPVVHLVAKGSQRRDCACSLLAQNSFVI